MPVTSNAHSNETTTIFRWVARSAAKSDELFIMPVPVPLLVAASWSKVHRTGSPLPSGTGMQASSMTWRPSGVIPPKGLATALYDLDKIWQGMTRGPVPIRKYPRIPRFHGGAYSRFSGGTAVCAVIPSNRGASVKSYHY